MHDVLPVSCADSCRNGADELPRALWQHRSFSCEYVLKRSAFYKLHDQERHRAAHDAKVSNGNDVRMADGRGRQRFLAKTRGEHRIVTNEIRQDYFYGVRRFEKDVSSLEDDTHATLPESSFEQVACVKGRFTQEGRRSFITILGTVSDF